MIPRWEDRVDAMDTGKGVSNKMVQTAMRAEIKDLRKALWWAERRLVQARQQRDDLKKTVTTQRKALAEERRKLCKRN